MTESTEARDHAVRAALVDTVAGTGRAPRRRRGTVLIAIVAFVLGGGLAAGVTSAAVAATRAPVPADVPDHVFAQILQGAPTVGPLVTYSGSASTQLELGPRPAGATGIVYYLRCGDDGRGDLVVSDLGGEKSSSAGTCKPGSGLGSSSQKDPTDSHVTVETDGHYSYTVWAQWFAAPAPAEPSDAQKAAVADGRISDAELHAAVDRFAACMTGAGYPISHIVYGQPEVSWEGDADEDGAITSGAEKRCEDAELSQVTALWYQQGDKAVN